jgi:hypothetical protein
MIDLMVTSLVSAGIDYVILAIDYWRTLQLFDTRRLFILTHACRQAASGLHLSHHVLHGIRPLAERSHESGTNG